MTATIKRIYWIPKNDPTQINDISDDVVDCVIRRGKDVKTNQFKIILRNNPINRSQTIYGGYVNSSTGKLRLVDGDFIKIWVKRSATDSEFTDDDYIMTGVLQVIETAGEEGSKTLSLNGTDNSYILLNKIWPKSYPSQPIPTTLKALVKDLTNANIGDGTFAIDTESGYVTTVRKGLAEDGTVNGDTAFPSRELTNYMKPAYTYVDMLSSPEFTNTDAELAGTESLVYSRSFMWWVDEFNDFHWFYPDDTADFTLEVGVDKTIRSYQLKGTQFESFNMVVWNAGEDDTSIAMTGYLFNYNTTLTDLKVKFIPFTDVGREHRDRLLETGVTLRNNVRKDVNARITKIFGTSAKNKLKGSIELYGAKYNVGDLITFIDTRNGINNKLRIVGLTYNISAQSFVTQLEVEEDEDKILSILS